MFSRIKNTWLRNTAIFSFVFLLAGCAGFSRSCSSWWATNVGADWIVAQYDMNGRPFMCWKLHNASVTSEQASDGIHWLDTTSSHMMHIAGWYNYIQVSGSLKYGDDGFLTAGKLLNVDASKCGSGVYPTTAN